MKVSISRYFHTFEQLKTVCQSRSLEVFGLLICGTMQQNKYFYILKSEKHLETRLHSISVLNSRSCYQRTTLPCDIQNSARFFQFHFTHYPPYQKGKSVLGTRKISKEVVLEKLYWSPAQVQKNEKLTNAVKSLMNENSKKWTHLLMDMFFPSNHHSLVKIICLTFKKVHTFI